MSFKRVFHAYNYEQMSGNIGSILKCTEIFFEEKILTQKISYIAHLYVFTNYFNLKIKESRLEAKLKLSLKTFADISVVLFASIVFALLPKNFSF